MSTWIVRITYDFHSKPGTRVWCYDGPDAEERATSLYSSCTRALDNPEDSTYTDMFGTVLHVELLEVTETRRWREWYGREVMSGG